MSGERQVTPPKDRQGRTLAEYLGSYDPSDFTATAVTVDLVVLTIRDGRLAVLLVKRAGHPFVGMWALPGGFSEADETLDRAAERELCEETSITSVEGHLEQLGTYGDPGRDPRMRVISVAYLVMLADLPVPQAGDDAAEAQWWPVDDLADGTGPLAFDHDRILADGIERVRAKLEYTTLASSFVEAPFTLSDLRRVYETVWGVPLHAANFARKVLGVDGFVEPIGEQQSSAAGRGRPAALYRPGPATALTPAMLRPGSD